MWQITLDEIMNTAFVPNGNYEWRKGIWTYFCPLCGAAVGMFSDGTVHDRGCLLKRDRCPNGHSVDWEAIGK